MLYNALNLIPPTNDLIFKRMFIYFLKKIQACKVCWNKEYPNIIILFINFILKRNDPLKSVELIGTDHDSNVEWSDNVMTIIFVSRNNTKWHIAIAR